MTNEEKNPGDAVLQALKRLRDAEQHQRKVISSQIRLSDNDQEALRLVVEAHVSDSGIGPKEIAGALEITSASVTVLLDRLEKRGLVRRTASPSDRRALHILPTETGSALSAAANATSPAHADIVRTLTAADAAVIVELLNRLRDTVSESSLPTL